MNNQYGIIMAGGLGERLWPISTSKNPKQYQDFLMLGKTLIQQTYDRLVKIIPNENIYVITNIKFIELTKKQLPNLKKNQIIGEPLMKNTAASNLYLAKKIHSLNPDAKLVIMPSDHIIINEKKFIKNIEFAFNILKNNEYLISLGIKPTYPNIGYGYIQFIRNKKKFKKVKMFIEKPTLSLAYKFIKSKDFLWNAGIFIWSSNTILKTFEKIKPDMFYQFSKIDKYYNTSNEKQLINKIYPMLANISIDYAIMENTNNLYVIPSNFIWSDLGTWKSLHTFFKKNKKNNVIKGDFIKLNNSKNCMINSLEKKKIIIDGLDNYLIINTPKVLLICPIDNEKYIKEYIKKN